MILTMMTSHSCTYICTHTYIRMQNPYTKLSCRLTSGSGSCNSSSTCSSTAAGEEGERWDEAARDRSLIQTKSLTTAQGIPQVCLGTFVTAALSWGHQDLAVTFLSSSALQERCLLGLLPELCRPHWPLDVLIDVLSHLWQAQRGAASALGPVPGEHVSFTFN